MKQEQNTKSAESNYPFIHSSENICTKKNRFKESLGFGFLWVSALLVLGILGWVLYYIISQGGSQAFSLKYLFTPSHGGKHDTGGLLYPLIGTVYLIIASLLASAPVGIFAAIYLNEYSDPADKFTQWARFAIDSLAGIPSVIYGLFGLAFFVSFLGFKHSILAASLSVSVMILPVIIRTAEEAIASVPQSYRDASFALGANKVETIFSVVLPNSLEGIFTGIMLSIGRVVAESAVVILAAGGSITSLPRLFGFEYPFVLPDSGRSLAVHLYWQAITYDSYQKAFATAVILILLILLLNLSVFLRKSSFKKGKW